MAGRGTSPARGAASLASLKTGLPLPLGLGCESHWKIRVSGNMIFRIYIIYMKIILYNISDISLFIYIYYK